MAMITPFVPVLAEQKAQTHTVRVLNRTYTFGADAMLQSIIASGKELLAAPIRLVGREEGEDMVWYSDYDVNESESFVARRSDEEVVICGAMRTKRFIVDQKITVSYDGSIDVAMTLMPAGQTVAEIFGVKAEKRPTYALDSLTLEIPIRGDAISHYSMYPANEVQLSDGRVLPKNAMSNSGSVQPEDMFFPFEPLLWFGREECGLGIYADNAKGRELNDPKRAIELLHTPDGNYLVRIRWMDHHPTEWDVAPQYGCYGYGPLTMRFGLMATPVKPFPKKPYYHKALHLDCFVKTPGNYIDFLSDEGRFDRLKEKGVDTLILHEKWNKQQNCFEPSEYTMEQLKRIVEECHARGIRVLTYFGYEISTLSVDFDQVFDEAKAQVGEKHSGGWYRVPFQRAYNVCYRSSLQERFLKGIERVMDICHIDGVYLDGTATPIFCMNERHGCRWTDHEGKDQGSFPVTAVRSLFRKLYEIVHSRGGYLSVHAYGCMNFTALPYIDLSWYGENLQTDYIKGNFSDVPLDYFRAEYTGRNMGVPVEFIAYEKRPIWNFENALAIALIHGILPRPNDIEGPLELMSGIWRIMDRFPLEQAQWCPYWENGVVCSSEKVKVSYYRGFTGADKPYLLVLVANTACTAAKDITFQLKEPRLRLVELTNGTEAPAPEAFDMEPYSYRIFGTE